MNWTNKWLEINLNGKKGGQLATSLQKRETLSPATSMIVKAVLLYKSVCSNKKKKHDIYDIYTRSVFIFFS